MTEADSILVKRVQSGDREAYGQLAERYAPTLTAIALAHTGNGEVARDLAQEAFVEGFRRIALLREGGKFAPWIASICRHRTLDWIRRRGRERAANREFTAAAEGENHAPGPLAELVKQEEREQLARAVMTLPDIDREIILLRYTGDLTRSETAEILEITPAAADKRLQRALEKLRHILNNKRDSG